MLGLSPQRSSQKGNPFGVNSGCPEVWVTQCGSLGRRTGVSSQVQSPHILHRAIKHQPGSISFLVLMEHKEEMAVIPKAPLNMQRAQTLL